MCIRDRCKGYDFFSYMDLSSNANSNNIPDSPENPVIPGSEIRGPVRSVHEACLLYTSPSFPTVICRQLYSPANVPVYLSLIHILAFADCDKCVASTWHGFRISIHTAFADCDVNGPVPPSCWRYFNPHSLRRL